MKKIIFLTMVFCIGVVSWIAYPKDPVLEKADGAALTEDLRKNDKNAEALVWLIRRSINSKQIETAYKTLDEMRHEQPNNAIVLAAYAMAHDASIYQVHKKSGIIRERTEQEDAEYKKALQRAKEIAPKLWLPYTLEGFRISRATHANYSEGLNLLYKGVLLAPKSGFARKQYAQILHHAAANNVKWKKSLVTFQQAATEYEIAH